MRIYALECALCIRSVALVLFGGEAWMRIYALECALCIRSVALVVFGRGVDEDIRIGMCIVHSIRGASGVWVWGVLATLNVMRHYVFGLRHSPHCAVERLTVLVSSRKGLCTSNSGTGSLR
jgi:hypothetical protein